MAEFVAARQSWGPIDPFQFRERILPFLPRNCVDREAGLRFGWNGETSRNRGLQSRGMHEPFALKL